MKSLHEILTANGSDKGGFHRYGLVYERYFEPMRNKPIRIMEFGVDTGASIRAWLEYFPFAEVVGCDMLDCPAIDDPRYEFRRGLVTDAEVWRGLGWFDIIIDDNGHSTGDAIAAVTFGMEHLKPGGLLIIEDLHTSYSEVFTPKGTQSTMDFLRELVDRMNDFGQTMCGDNRKDACEIQSIHFWKSLAIITRRSDTLGLV